MGKGTRHCERVERGTYKGGYRISANGKGFSFSLEERPPIRAKRGSSHVDPHVLNNKR